MWSPTGKPVGRNPEREPPAKAGARVEGSNRLNWVVALSTEEGWLKECRRSEDAAGENPL